MLPTHEPLNPSLAQLLRNHLAPITPLQFCPSTALLQVQVQNCLLPRLSWKNLHEPRRRRAAQSQGSSLGKAPRSFAASRLVFMQRTWSAAPRNCILCCAVAVFGIVGPRCCVHKEFHRARSTPRELRLSPRVRWSSWVITAGRVFVGELVENPTLACGRAIKICLPLSWCVSGDSKIAPKCISRVTSVGDAVSLLRLAVNEQNADLAWLRDDEPLINHFHFRYCSVVRRTALRCTARSNYHLRNICLLLQSLDHAFTSPRSPGRWVPQQSNDLSASSGRLQAEPLQVPLIFGSSCLVKPIHSSRTTLAGSSWPTSSQPSYGEEIIHSGGHANICHLTHFSDRRLVLQVISRVTPPCWLLWRHRRGGKQHKNAGSRLVGCDFSKTIPQNFHCHQPQKRWRHGRYVNFYFHRRRRHYK